MNSFYKVYHIVMGPGQKFVTQVRLGQFFVARVGLGQPFMVWVWVWKISPKNVKFFPSGWVKKYTGQRRVGLLFTKGQK